MKQKRKISLVFWVLAAAILAFYVVFLCRVELAGGAENENPLSGYLVKGTGICNMVNESNQRIVAACYFLEREGERNIYLGVLDGDGKIFLILREDGNNDYTVVWRRKENEPKREDQRRKDQRKRKEIMA